ncbi:MAG: hypothetical protein ACYC3I_06450 [Gemmataceae bacterium]
MFTVACRLVHGFGLSISEAYPHLAAYNARCQPPFSERELLHKLADANNCGDRRGRQRGYLLENRQENGGRATKTGTPQPPIPIFVARPPLDHAFFASEIPCPKGPKAVFGSVKKQGEYFAAGMRCLKWGCPSCIARKKQFWSDRILFGLEKLSAAGWHIASFDAAGWRNRIGPSFSRAGAHYARIKYDGAILLIADKPFPSSELLPVAKAWDRVVEQLRAMEPDRWSKRYGAVVETHRRGASLSRNWPKPEIKDVLSSKNAFLGIVKAELLAIQAVLDKWEFENYIWDTLPRNFQWAIGFCTTADMTPEETVNFWVELGLKPRNGESIANMAERLRGLFAYAKSA